jgi:hypothetical protein
METSMRGRFGEGAWLLLSIIGLILFGMLITYAYFTFSGWLISAMGDPLKVFTDAANTAASREQSLAAIQALADLSGLMIGIPVSIVASFVAIYIAYRANKTSDMVRDIAERQDKQEFRLWVKMEAEAYDAALNAVGKALNNVLETAGVVCRYFASHPDAFYQQKRLPFSHAGDDPPIFLLLRSYTPNLDEHKQLASFLEDYRQARQVLFESITEALSVGSEETAADTSLRLLWRNCKHKFIIQENGWKEVFACDAYLRDGLFNRDTAKPLRDLDAERAQFDAGNDESYDYVQHLQVEFALGVVDKRLLEIVGAMILIEPNRCLELYELPSEERDRLVRKAFDDFQSSIAQVAELAGEMSSDYIAEMEEEMSSDYVYEMEEKFLECKAISKQHDDYVAAHVGTHGGTNRGLSLLVELLALLSIDKRRASLQEHLEATTLRVYFHSGGDLPQIYRDLITQVVKERKYPFLLPITESHALDINVPKPVLVPLPYDLTNDEVEV